ncbi:penicillin-binding protein [Paenibacillus lutimineralis]|uniref:PASTA domain-containing protein n=1 Tax=Paenibacillus lutimineralis TaxID=2707005 RepID=A0A3Q9I8D5_9BACL|nr:PASTA domain-containing penicillin-binding protein [Paenibacillus lutimineralis]AZS15011.1 PASTA domain-containing protein [Paenibacillus lutimineralis]
MIRRLRLRTLVIGGCITFFFIVLMIRVFWLQVMETEFWTAYAEQQWSRKQTLYATRGTITDRNGEVLAMMAPAYTVSVNPKLINSLDLQEEVAEGLSEVLGKNKADLIKLVNAKNKEGSFYVQREVRYEGYRIDQDLSDQVEVFARNLKDKHELDDVGIYLTKEQKRFYPWKSLAAHVLGYVDRDGIAISGLESLYDEELKGQDGSFEYKSDGRGITVTRADEIYNPAKNGMNIELTIDHTIQYYIEEAMKEAFNELKPISMTVIAADPKTMEILGMANLPTYNPNEYWLEDDLGNFYNHAIKSVYEPGSTFKIVTLAGAVQEDLFNPKAKYMSGSIRVPGQTLHDIKRSGWGRIDYLEGVMRSSNVAFVKLGYEMLGPERLKQYVDNFGFGQKTGIELPGEAAGVVSPEQPSEYATMSYGHGKLMVTPLQQLAAVGAVANGGMLLKPHIIKSITDPQSGEVIKTQPEPVRQVISADKAKEVGEYLEQVVSNSEYGTGRRAYIEGYRIAGKTGTAVKPFKGKYDYTKQVVSFIGYAPVDDPKVVMLVLIDEPKDSDLGGGKAAAPVFQKIMKQMLQYMGVRKTITAPGDSDLAQNTAMLRTPDLSKLSLQQALTELRNTDIPYALLGNGKELVSQFPKPGSSLMKGQQVYLLTEAVNHIKIPDLKGQSLRDALELLSVLNIYVTFEGEGFVVSQTVLEDSGNKQVKLVLEPPGGVRSESEEDEEAIDADGEENG